MSLFTNLDTMIAKTKPEMIIVTTKDATHHYYIIKGLKYGVQALTEKPLGHVLPD